MSCSEVKECACLCANIAIMWMCGALFQGDFSIRSQPLCFTRYLTKIVISFLDLRIAHYLCHATEREKEG